MCFFQSFPFLFADLLIWTTLPFTLIVKLVFISPFQTTHGTVRMMAPKDLLTGMHLLSPDVSILIFHSMQQMTIVKMTMEKTVFLVKVGTAPMGPMLVTSTTRSTLTTASFIPIAMIVIQIKMESVCTGAMI